MRIIWGFSAFLILMVQNVNSDRNSFLHPSRPTITQKISYSWSDIGVVEFLADHPLRILTKYYNFYTQSRYFIKCNPSFANLLLKSRKILKISDLEIGEKLIGHHNWWIISRLFGIVFVLFIQMSQELFELEHEQTARRTSLKSFNYLGSKFSFCGNKNNYGQ